VSIDAEPAGGEGARHSARELAALVGVTTALVRAWTERGLLPRGATYGFRELARARELARLSRGGWTPARLGKAVQRAGSPELDVDAVLAGLESEPGEAPVVRTADGRLRTEGGQGLFDFAEQGGARTASVHDLRSPADWFQLGVEAEAEGRLADAVRAYGRAVPDAGAEAWFNLGNCRYQLGDADGARESFEQAVARVPDYAEAWNNLGIVLGALQQGAAAIAAFRRALLLVPHYADAHYNLAEALAGSGDVAAARAHWRAYLGFDPNSRWAERARSRLQGPDGGAG
jgi:tetratricopeptide (TPR) repeat protein